MIEERESLAYVDEVRASETCWLKANGESILGLIDRFSEDFETENLLNTVIGLPKERALRAELEEYYGFDPTAPTAGSNLIVSAWRDLRETVAKFSSVGQLVEEGDLRIMSKLMNEFLLPASGIEFDPTGTTVEAEITESSMVAACASAELYFSHTYEEIMPSSSSYYNSQPKISVYHDDSGEPIALRKSHDVSSALTLSPIKLYGSIVPAGSIIGVDRDRDRTGQPTMSGSAETNGKLFQTFLIGKSFLISPARLSPWAYNNPIDRTLFAIEATILKGRIDPYRLDVVRGLELDCFRRAAQFVMERCETTTMAQAA